ncbi:MAG: lysozyme inhibitor LprI family protein [Rhodocyclaceae bacterium]
MTPVSVLLLACNALAADEFECNYSGNQQEMNACAVRDYKQADQALNQEYGSLMARLAPEQQLQLRKAQRAWLKKRDPQCRKAVRDSEGGSIWQGEFYSCLEEVTINRTQQLKQWQVRK